MLKSIFHSTKLKLLNCRDFKHFRKEDFEENFREGLYDCDHSYDDFNTSLQES